MESVLRACRFGICLSVLALSTQVRAKGPTIKILIEGDGLETPLSITDPELVKRYSIWSGPRAGTQTTIKAMREGKYGDLHHTQRWFIDWSKGVSDRPKAGLQRLQVSLSVGRETDFSEYVFLYEFDSEQELGYIYLPSWKNSLIWHGIEPNWVHSHKRWDDVILPIINKHSEWPNPNAEQTEINCIIGPAVLRNNGDIEFDYLNKSGEVSSRWRYKKSDSAYAQVRSHIGDVSPEQPFDLSCWPPRG